MGPDLHHIRTFIHAVRLESFHKTATYLNLTQPSISDRIDTIETAITKKIFVRTAKGVKPTALGEELYRRCVAAIDAYDEFLRRAELHDGPLVTVGVVEMLVKEALKSIAERMRREKPTLAVRPEIGDKVQLEAGVRSGKLDLAVIAVLEPPIGLCWRPIAQYRIGVLVPSSSDITDLKTIFTRRTSPHRLICPGINGAVYESVLRGCGRLGIRCEASLEATSELIQIAVASGRDFGVCAAIKPNCECPGVRMLVADDFDPITVGILSRADAGPDAQWMINLVADEFGRIGPTLAVD